MDDENTFNMLASFMSSIGLGSLFSVNANGTPGGWLWKQDENGIVSKEELTFSLETTPEFKQRFPIIFEQRDRAAKGESVQVMTAEQVLQYEDNYRSTMRNAGLPLWFYDEISDAHNAIRTNLAVTQIEDRVKSSYNTVVNMPKEVRDAFAEYYGDASDQALLAAVLDPQKSLAQLDRASKASAFGGFSKLQGVNVSKDQAEQYANMGKDIAYAQSDAAKVAELQPLTSSTFGESGNVISGDAAFKAGALSDAGSMKELEDRLLGRQAQQRDSAGGAFVSQSGTTGLGGQK